MIIQSVNTLKGLHQLMADTIFDNAQRIGLAVCRDAPTPGDGNCFYHSVIQQLARNDVRPVIRHVHLSHSILRGMVYVCIQENYNNELPVKSDQPFEGCTAIPDRCVTNSVVTSVFGDKFDGHAFADRVILCPTNDESLRLNEAILQCCIPGDTGTYFSSDDILTDDDEEGTISN